ncbi:MAG TPA: hypothetical protein VMT86_06335 [Bryobacteraceae bacterium]|nr:hypothetical protein [Bryobacteraceae bacterium]
MSILSLVPVFFLAAVAGPAAWALGRVYRRSRGAKHITCPEAGHFATIELDARHAVAMHALGETSRRIRCCSLWPERQGCKQSCLKLVV